MAQFSTFWAGFLAFMVFATVGIVITLILGGMFLDPIYDVGRGLPHGDETTYNKMQQPIFWYINLYYFVGIGSSVLGAVIFGQSVVKKVRVSQYVYR